MKKILREVIRVFLSVTMLFVVAADVYGWGCHAFGLPDLGWSVPLWARAFVISVVGVGVAGECIALVQLFIANDHLALLINLSAPGQDTTFEDRDYVRVMADRFGTQYRKAWVHSSLWLLVAAITGFAGLWFYFVTFIAAYATSLALLVTSRKTLHLSMKLMV